MLLQNWIYGTVSNINSQAGFDLGAKNYRDFTPSTAGGAMFTAPLKKQVDNTTPTSTIVGLSKIC